jgi:hypothetical protein
MQAFGAPLFIRASKEAIIGYLTGGFAATFSYRKSGYSGNAVVRLP